MPAHFLAIEVLLKDESAAALWKLKEAAGKAGVFITGAERFANKALMLRLELEARNLVHLKVALEQIGSLLDPGGHHLMELAGTFDADTEFVVSLHVSLIHGAPDEPVEVPKVPG